VSGGIFSPFVPLLHHGGFIDGLGGWVCGFAQVATGHPLDTIKVRMQVQSAINPQYSSMRDCAVKVWRSEGVRGLFKGAAAPAVGATTLNAVLFGTYSQARLLFAPPASESWLDGDGATASGGTARSGPGADELTLGQIWCCGFLAGSCVAAVEAPDDLLKVKLQSQFGRSGTYKGVFDAARVIIRARGILGLYQGYGATILRNAPGCANSLMVYEACARELGKWATSTADGNVHSAPGMRMTTTPSTPPPLWVSMISGAVAGLAFWALTYPLEIIKSRLQADSVLASDRRYRSWADCARQTYGERGLAGMYRGFLPCQLRGIVVNAAVFGTMEAWHQFTAQLQDRYPLPHNTT